MFDTWQINSTEKDKEEEKKRGRTIDVICGAMLTSTHGYPFHHSLALLLILSTQPLLP